jgi:hypothetical protein
MPSPDTTHCLATIGTMTMAIKAQRTLLDLGLHAEVRSLLKTKTRRGCAFGITFPCEAKRAVRTALQAARIPVGEYLEEDAPL